MFVKYFFYIYFTESAAAAIGAAKGMVTRPGTGQAPTRSMAPMGTVLGIRTNMMPGPDTGAGSEMEEYVYNTECRYRCGFGDGSTCETGRESGYGYGWGHGYRCGYGSGEGTGYRDGTGNGGGCSDMVEHV